mgnify:FL=1
MSSDEEIRLRRFAALMAREIDANAHKGSREARNNEPVSWWLEEIDRHVEKLRKAAETHDVTHGPAHKSTHAEAAARVREHAVDVANLALFLLDSLGMLEEEPSTVTYGSSIYGEDYR